MKDFGRWLMAAGLFAVILGFMLNVFTISLDGLVDFLEILDLALKM